MKKLYFHIGKLFGLRAKEHRSLRLDVFLVGNNEITLVENVSKTYHGGLKDLKRTPRNMKHHCHADNEKNHRPCVVELLKKYMMKVEKLTRHNEAFYFRPSRKAYKFETYPVGIHTLNSILSSLMDTAGLKNCT